VLNVTPRFFWKQGEEMDVVWSMTSLESGLFCPGERRSGLPVLTDGFNELRSRGQGYMEVRLPDSVFPQLTLAFRDDCAVVHLFADEESVFLLAGDGTVPPVAAVGVPIVDDPAVFTGDFVLSVERAWDAIRKFVRVGGLKSWGVA
jgi:hypothetical protein